MNENKQRVDQKVRECVEYLLSIGFKWEDYKKAWFERDVKFDFLKPPQPAANDDEQMKREVKKEHHHDGNKEIHYQIRGINNDG